MNVPRIHLEKARHWVSTIIGLCVLLIAIINIYPVFRDWILWRKEVAVPKNELTILISQFRSDPDGKYTSQVEAGLLEKGWESVRFRRTLSSEEIVESSREKRASEREMATSLFLRHGGDVLITGEVAALDGIVRVRIFDRDGTNSANVDLDFQTEWMKVLTPYVERIVLDGLTRAGAFRFGKYDDEFLRRALPIESKALNLAELTLTSEELHKEVRGVHRRLSTKIGYILGDVSRLTSVRQELERKLSNKSSFKTDHDRILAMADVADLSRAEALVLGDTRLLDSSFALSREIRGYLGVSEIDVAAQDELEKNPLARDILESESVIALACRDQRRIDELLKLYERIAACRTDTMDTSCPAWATRAIFSLRYGRIAWSSNVLRIQAAAYTASHWASTGYGGRVSHWTDPMTHADRLLRARLGIGPDTHIPFPSEVQLLPNGIPDENACPNLIRLFVLLPELSKEQHLPKGK